MKTEREAFLRMHEVLTRISQQFINKDGMTGGRSVLMAAAVLAEVKEAKLDPNEGVPEARVEEKR